MSSSIIRFAVGRGWGRGGRLIGRFSHEDAIRNYRNGWEIRLLHLDVSVSSFSFALNERKKLFATLLCNLRCDLARKNRTSELVVGLDHGGRFLIPVPMYERYPQSGSESRKVAAFISRSFASDNSFAGFSQSVLLETTLRVAVLA